MYTRSVKRSRGPAMVNAGSEWNVLAGRKSAPSLTARYFTPPFASFDRNILRRRVGGDVDESRNGSRVRAGAVAPRCVLPAGC